MGSPRPCCCPSGCWSCTTEPDTVAFTNSGTGCCARPAGTYTVGAASNSSIVSNQNYTYNESTHSLANNPLVVYPCTWSWVHTNPVNYYCNLTGDLLTTGSGSSTAGYALCESNIYYAPAGLGGPLVDKGSDNWIAAQPIVHAFWKDTATRIGVVIKYTYYLIRCNDGGTAQSVNTHEIYDEYMSTVSCGSLPATINFSGRYKNNLSASVPTTQTYGVNSTGGSYTFTFCPPLASVDLTYA